MVSERGALELNLQARRLVSNIKELLHLCVVFAEDSGPSTHVTVKDLAPRLKRTGTGSNNTQKILKPRKFLDEQLCLLMQRQERVDPTTGIIPKGVKV